MELRKCKKCSVVQEIEDFPKAMGCYGDRAPTCKACKNKVQRDNYIIGSSYKDKDRDKHYKRKYGISLEIYNQMLVDQKGVCKICGTKTPGVSINHFHVDHCHTTGVVRGLLCSHCNTGLGRFKDKQELLLAAVFYLKETQDAK